MFGGMTSEAESSFRLSPESSKRRKTVAKKLWCPFADTLFDKTNRAIHIRKRPSILIHRLCKEEEYMRVGATIVNQNYTDWDRYEAEERGEKVSARASKPDSEVFREELNLVRFADEAGFDSVWTIEHHFTPYTMVTNPMQYLTYVSAITKNVDLGTMVNVLPWRHPVQLAEDIIMLHTFLGPNRQFFCGVGRGLGRREYEGLGIDQADGRGRFDESLLILRELLATGMCKFDGKHYHLKGVRLRPQPERD